LVSAGPPGKSMTMPDLAGISLAEAKAALKRLGITDIKVSPDGATDKARVTGHDPLVGKTIFQTDRVTITARE